MPAGRGTIGPTMWRMIWTKFTEAVSALDLEVTSGTERGSNCSSGLPVHQAIQMSLTSDAEGAKFDVPYPQNVHTQHIDVSLC